MTGRPPARDLDQGRAAATVLRHEAYTVYPWRNGRGRVRHIADGEGWQLRLADIVDSGPFSDYAGHLRLFAMVEGAAVLEMPDGRRVHCDPESPVAIFDGGAAPLCSLVTAPARALNLIARTDQVLASLERRRIGKADIVAIEGGGEASVAIHVESGQVECARSWSDGRPPASGARVVPARAGDTLIPTAGDGVLLRAGGGAAEAVVLVGRIQPLPGASPTPSTPTDR